MLLEGAGQGTPPLKLDEYGSAIGFAVVAHDFGEGEFRTPRLLHLFHARSRRSRRSRRSPPRKTR